MSCTETTVWFDEISPSAIPFYDNFGYAWDMFVAGNGAMLEHRTEEGRPSYRRKGRTVFFGWPGLIVVSPDYKAAAVL